MRRVVAAFDTSAETVALDSGTARIAAVPSLLNFGRTAWGAVDFAARAAAREAIAVRSADVSALSPRSKTAMPTVVSADGNFATRAVTLADSAVAGSPESGYDELLPDGRNANSSATASTVRPSTSQDVRRERKAAERVRMIIP